MFDAGLLTICSLKNTAAPGMMPKDQLVKICTVFYDERTVGVTRAYAAMSADQRIDMLVRCYNVALPVNAEYVVMEDGTQYRISLKQTQGDHIDLTLERLEDYYDVISAED